MTFAWSPGGDFGSPIYSLPIQVVDGVVSTLLDEKRRRWKDALTRALASWMLPFAVSYRAEKNQPWIANNTTVSTFSVNPLIIAGKIALVRLHVDQGTDSAGWIQEMGGGICLLTPWRGWWAPFPKTESSGIIAHEIGHALGFGHGGNGVMSGSNRPNAQERALAAAYYGV